MAQLPVVVGFGGINAAGRSSFHQGYRRLVLDALPAATQAQTLLGLAHLMHPGQDFHRLDPAQQQHVRDHTLLRRIETTHFNVDAVPLHKRLQLQEAVSSLQLAPGQDILLPMTQRFAVSTAGQLPSGFDPGHYYASHHHPRALQMTVFGANDALNSLGIAWDELRRQLAPERIAVYAASAHGQLDDAGAGGMLKSPWQGKRQTAKQCPLGFAEMPADFINAYILGSVGRSAGILGACATFLYNLERAVTDIRDGHVDFAMVGASEAPILPEVMEGYRAMGALADDARLLELDRARGLNQPDHRRATRPFAHNAGFTMAESAQFVVLASDRFALAQGLPIHASVPGVFVHADGFKKSISAPGIGNYLTLGRAVGLARSLLGDEKLRRASYVQAHGTGTPQNRVTESHVFDRIAGAFGIEDWLIASIKCYVGHSLGAAAGDQFMAALGAWADGIVPGIFTLDAVAADVHRQHLRFSQAHVATDTMAACFINAKGFGGNNASALLLSPQQTHQLLQHRHGRPALQQWQAANDRSQVARRHYETMADQGRFPVRYRFGDNAEAEAALGITADTIQAPGHDMAMRLSGADPYSAYRENPPTKKS